MSRVIQVKYLFEIFRNISGTLQPPQKVKCFVLAFVHSFPVAVKIVARLFHLSLISVYFFIFNLVSSGDILPLDVQQSFKNLFRDQCVTMTMQTIIAILKMYDRNCQKHALKFEMGLFFVCQLSFLGQTKLFTTTIVSF